MGWVVIGGWSVNGLGGGVGGWRVYWVGRCVMVWMVVGSMVG